MVRPAPLTFMLVVSLSGAAAAGEPTATPTPTPTPTPSARKAGDKTPKRVFTNDDLEATKGKPSAVQDLTAKGGSVPVPAPAPVVQPAPPPEEAPEPEDPRTEEERQIAEAEANIKALDEQAKQLLWQYLQSTDTNEILRLKAEQQQVLEQLEAAKSELARLKGVQDGASPGPRPTPTRLPG